MLPGDLLDAGTMKPGEGTYVHDGKIFAAMLGIKSVKSNFVNVIPLGGRYIPAPGDMIIGKVIDIGPSNWLVDIYSPYPAPLHVNEVPWRVEFGDTARYLAVGDTLLAKVLSVDDQARTGDHEGAGAAQAAGRTDRRDIPQQGAQGDRARTAP